MSTAQPTVPTLDARTLASADRPAALLAAFDELTPGQTLILLSSEGPQPFLKQLQAQRKGLFEWAPLATDPRCWQVEITRRDSPAGAQRRITEALLWEHARLDALEQRAWELLRGEEREQARRLYSAFHSALDRHIRFEEEVLFPVFEVRTGLPHGGPTGVMRAEHREIRMLIEEIVRGLDDGASAVDEPRCTLLGVLADHRRREEGLLYPGTDQLLSDAESDALVAKIQAFPA
jgi:uncharacterized protein (DUF2249 family)